ncbi:MAG: starch-binding protein [Bacilli bacterium]|nr:starch-binding protein [Bacilli bacterium]
MKKGLIFATTLAMALGVGVAVGAHQSKAAEVKAATVSTVYCKNTQSWWKADGAAVGAYFFNSSTSTGVNTWPGDRMTVVEGQTDLWSASVPSGADSVIFTRVNGEGTVANWGAQTEDLQIQSKKNCFTITSETAQWAGDGNKAQGVWSVYPVVAPEYHLLGSFNLWNDPDDDYILTVDGEDANHFTFSSLELEANAELKVCDVKNDDWFDNGDGNVSVAEGGTYDVDFYVNADNNVHIVLTKQVVEPVYTIVNRGNAPVTFVLDEDEKPAGVKHQYSAEVQYAKRGGDLKFYADGVEITSGIGVDWDSEQEKPVAGNNVYGDVTNGFYLAHTVNYTGLTKIYLKTYEDGGISLWANGYQNNEFYSYIKDGQGSGQNVTLTLDTTFEPDETYIRQYKTSSAIAIKALAGTNWDTSFSLDCSGLGEDVTPEAGATNNARQAFQSSAWKVHNDCNEVIYVKERKTDLALFLYVGGYEEAHVLTIGGQNVALSKGEGNQYVAHGVALSAGDAVTAYTIEGEAVAVTSKKVANNNLKEDKTILANVASADIYYDTEAKNLWISGLPAAGQHLLKNGNTAIEMHHTDPFGDYDQYASGMLTFAANDTIKVLNTGADDSYAVVWCPDIVATSTALAGKFVYDSEKDEMKCVAACSAAVYLKIKSGVDEVYFGDVPEYVSKAIEFANGFKSAMATACSAEEGKQAAVEAAWELQATAFAALEDEVKDELKLGESSLVDEVIEFGQRYAGIYKQLGGKYELEDFLESGIVPNVRFYIELGVTGNNSAMIIVISIAAASALAFTLLLVFKKKKQK